MNITQSTTLRTVVVRATQRDLEVLKRQIDEAVKDGYSSRVWDEGMLTIIHDERAE